MDHKEIRDFNRRLGKKLREVRIAHGLTQQQLGDCAGVSFQQIQKNENGQNRISAERLFRISKRLNVPIGFFFDGAADQAHSRLLPSETIRLAADIDRLPDTAIIHNVRSLVGAISNAWGRHAK